MADFPGPPKSPTLQPPRKSVELEDPGAHDLGSENEEDVFADAQEGHKTLSEPGSSPHSPVPITRVEKVDNEEGYGDVPGTEAFKMRAQDAVPDEVEIIPEDGGKEMNISGQDKPLAPGGIPIPKTVVEKIDSTNPGHEHIHGAAAHSSRRADAVPNEIIQVSEPEQGVMDQPSSIVWSDETPIPKTVVTKVDEQASHGEVPGTEAHEIRKADAEPDAIEKKSDLPGLPTSSQSRSTISAPKRRKQSLGGSPIAADGGFGPMNYEESDESNVETADDRPDASDEEAEEGFGDDFDDFEAGAEGEDFGEFNDGFQEPEESQMEAEKNVQPDPSSISRFPLLDFSSVNTLDDLLTTTSTYLDTIFPSTKETPPPPPPLPPSTPNPIFLTPRSTSLYSQLSAPPPLQPPNWLRSRIRRLFLVSLGVPVDLDEILPASKQKKLILPSTPGLLRSDSPRSTVERLKQDPNNTNRSRTSLDSGGGRTSSPGTKSRNARRRGPAPPPDLDISETRILCSTTDAALEGMEDGELRVHVARLEEMTGRASEVLEYWLKRRDEGVREKEAFEGVIENLVRHARRVRK